MQEIAQLSKVLVSITDKSNTQLKSYKVESLESKFINGILSNKYSTDKEAAFDLYGQDQSDFRYKMLKHRIKKKILNQLLSIEVSSNQGVLQKEQECLRLINIAKLLLKKSVYDVVIGLCRKIRAIASEYEFNELYLSALEIEAICIADKGTHKEFNRLITQQQKYYHIVNLEKEAIGLYQKSKVNIKSTIKHRKLYLEKLPQIIDRLKEIWDEIKTYESYNAYFKTSILYYELTGNFSEIIRVAEETEKLIVSNIVNSTRFSIKYNAYILVYSLLRNQSFQKGLEYADKFSSYFEESNTNWFPYMENYFLLALHAKEYELAASLLKRVQENEGFRRIHKSIAERWQLFNAYLHFFQPTYSTPEEFNFYKFLNSLTEYSKDKQGFNVAIQILQFMYLLKKNDSETLLYKVESLKKYSSTHLKDTFNMRSRLFLKLLMLTVSEDFDAETSRLKGEKYFKKLNETPTPGDAYAEIEIIPYEHLWEMVLNILEKRS